MVQQFNILNMVTLPKDAQAYRARGDKGCYIMLAEEVCVILDHLLRRIGLAREHQWAATAYATLAIGIPHILTHTLEDLTHGALHGGRERCHTSSEEANPTLAH
jgi:hypothetical protein